jgi:hypothetical protein
VCKKVIPLGRACEKNAGPSASAEAGAAVGEQSGWYRHCVSVGVGGILDMINGLFKEEFSLPAVALLAVFMIAGCASTRITSQWTNPEMRSPSFKRIMVIGVSEQASIRRSFEDEFVQRLRSAGQDAVPSYRFIPQPGKVSEAILKRAVDQAGADGAIITRLLRVEQRVQISPGYRAPVHPFGFYGWYSHAWTGYYEPPHVYPHDVYISETTLHDVRRNEVIWSGTVRTPDPDDVQEAIEEYVQTVMRELDDRDILNAG